jgi:hypothetical protein
MLFGKDGANSVIIHRIAYFLGIRLILSDPQVIVVSAYIPYFFTYSWERVLDMTHSPLLVPPLLSLFDILSTGSTPFWG